MADKKNNMDLWNQICKTDPDAVKEIGYGARKFHAIDASWQRKQMTKTFGSWGKAIGVKDEKFLMITTTVLLYQATFFYPDGEFPIASSIEVIDKSGRVDSESVKKVITDALTKGWSFLGGSADVFENKFSDNKYVNTVKEEKAQEAKADQQALIDEKLKELAALAKSVLVVAKKAADTGEPDVIKALWTDNKPLHNVKGFKAAMTKHGAAAKEVLANKEATDAED